MPKMHVNTNFIMITILKEIILAVLLSTAIILCVLYSVDICMLDVPDMCEKLNDFNKIRTWLKTCICAISAKFSHGETHKKGNVSP